MKIGIAKIGQKIIFDRESNDVKRSNTNGNVGLYMLSKLLIENNENDEFYFLSSSDVNNTEYKNAGDVSFFNCEETKCMFGINGPKLDLLIVIAGLVEYEKDEELFTKLNNCDNISKRTILLSEDPRCLDSIRDSDKLTFMPGYILSQFEGSYIYKDVIYNVKYVPLETSIVYGLDELFEEYPIKNEAMIISSNTSGKEYNRAKIVGDITNDTEVKIYGRLSDNEKEYIGKSKCVGEIKYDEMQMKMQESYSTFLVPIKKDWVTSKYVEALLNYCLPIFYKDYNVDLISNIFDSPIIVNSSNDFNLIYNAIYDKKLFGNYKSFDDMMVNLVLTPRRKLIKEYFTGKKLSDAIMAFANGREHDIL